MTQPAASSSSTLPLLVDALAAELVLLYSQAEQQILTRFATLIETTPAGALLGVLRREAILVAAELRRQSSPLAARIARTAALQGDSAALDQLRRIVETSEPVRSLGASSVESIAARAAADLQQRLAATWPQVTRFADDTWRAASIDETFAGLTHHTPAVAQRIAWQRLVERGVSGFTDRAGRRWNLATYVEMATRTAVQHTFNAAHLQRMVAAGIDKFTVPSDGHPCPLCKPWEGRVLTVSGPGPTIAEAAAAGLWHPNCRHTLVAYFDGVTQLRPSSWTNEDQTRYDATQRLRALERDVRAHKRVAAASLSVLDQKRAERKVRQIQSQIRAHVDEHGLVRRPRREQLDLGNNRGGEPPKPPEPPKTGGGGGEPPDDEWRRRQEALGIETNGEQLEPHEIEFIERFVGLGHHVEWLPRDPTRRPSHDFLWLDRDSMPIELKTTRADYMAIHGRLVDAMSRAAKHNFRKTNFIVDLGEQPLTSALASDLEDFNVGRHTHRLDRLWVMSEDGRHFVEIRLN